MSLIQFILRPFSPTYFIAIRKSFSLINGITYELLNASLFLRGTEHFMGTGQFLCIQNIIGLKPQ